MNYNKFFELANEKKIEALELYIVKNTKFSFSLLNKDIDSYTSCSSFKISARGIYNGKMGYASSEKLDNTTPEFIISKIIENASLITNNDIPTIFKGSEKYHKKNVFSKELEQTKPEEKIALVKEIINNINNLEPRIRDIESQYEDDVDEITLINSYGLKLTSKANYCYVYVSGVADDDRNETKNGYKLKLYNSIKECDSLTFAKEVIKNVISKFNSEPCETKKYKAVFSPSTSASLLQFFLSNLSMEEILKGSSLFKDKINAKIASSKITIQENPLTKNFFFRYFDDEGVATYNKTIIKNGKLLTYLYNLDSSKKCNTNSTGNGYKNGNKIETSLVNVYVKPGKLSEEQLFEKMGEGIYITELEGLHAGMNAKSGNFSLQSQGFLVENGKITRPVSLITVAGNLFTFFQNVIEVGNNNELQTSSYNVPSLLVKEISISGK